MTRPDTSVTPREEGLLRYVDDRLEHDDRAAVERWLKENADDMQRTHDWHRNHLALRRHFEPIAHAAVPENLLRAAQRASRRSPVRYATAAVWLVVGCVIGYLAAHLSPQEVSAPPSPGLALAQQAAIAHAIYLPERRHAVEVGADQEDHLVTWLSKRLGVKVNAPKLQERGYELVGGRLLPSEAGPMAQFMYQDAAGHRLTLYVRTDSRTVADTSFQFSRQGSVSVFYWLDDKVGYALSGELERNELLQIARTVYQQLNR